MLKDLAQKLGRAKEPARKCTAQRKRRLWPKHFIIFSLALGAFSAGARARAEEMSFRDGPSGVYADGKITQETDFKLWQFLLHHPLFPGAILYLNSPSGNIEGALRLGSSIRFFGLTTDVARLTPGKDESSPGICVGACLLAYLGGPVRMLRDGSRLGLGPIANRQLEPTAGLSNEAFSAALGGFIKEMGVMPELLGLWSEPEPKNDGYLSKDELTALHVTGDATSSPSKPIDPAQSLRTKGSQTPTPDLPSSQPPPRPWWPKEWGPEPTFHSTR
jgi:hypothetical protein